MDILTETRNHNKENHHNDKEILKLRVELNDRIFELHKLEEDHAQQKAQIYIQLQKEKQHYNKTIKELRDKIKDDNQQWANKIQEVRAQKQESIIQLKQEIEKALQNAFSNQRKQIEERHSKEVAQLQGKLSHQIEQHRQRQEQLIRQSKVNAESITHTYLKQQQEKERLHKKTLNDLKQEYQSNITKMQNLFVNEEINRRKAENEMQNSIISHIREKITWESTENTLKSEINKLNERLTQLQQSLHHLSNQKDEAQLAHKAQLQQIHSNFSTQMKQLAEHHNEVQRQNCYRYSLQIAKLKEQIGRVIEVHKRKQQCWHQSGKMVLQLYQKRQSKKEDVKAIQKLQVQLIKKDFLIERQRKELQNCKLELENMEEVYDRIFIFSSNINRAKTKSYQIKKTKNSCQLHPSNRSTITDKRYAEK